ncbi:FAD-dependent oxidoreductase [uncultured Cohaesibacter sp.]|uniref:NAD(P)/FAD-dependent oxidoreductase n=1 Tax=uncultured Cohaesibacter sp. TaxID=1002546 RepID=UPI0029C8E4D5|nr:FAD-dependent oxidoreductase [uncultured Cohaesibacter sp.]
MQNPFIIIGAGQAGMKAAETLRNSGYEGSLLMIGDEDWLPYQRPPLSKAYLKGELGEDRLFLKSPDFFKDKAIDFLGGKTVTAIDPNNHTITLSDGDMRAYSKLLLSTGTRARTLPIPGAELAGVHSLRSINDTKRIAADLKSARRVVIIGGGYIGLEFAAVAASMGKSIAVIEAQERVLARSVAPEMSAFFEDLHKSHGVDLVLGQGVAAIVGNGSVSSVQLASGETMPADLVLIAAGAIPNAELAMDAGIDNEQGILVDSACHTSAPDIYAAGDCAKFHSARFGSALRLESVQNASDQGKVAALSMLGQDARYDPVPWFWSDQYDVKLQIAGINQGYDRTEIVGDPASGRFSLKYFRGNRLLAVDSVNDPRSHMMARKDLARPRDELAA